MTVPHKSRIRNFSRACLWQGNGVFEIMECKHAGIKVLQGATDARRKNLVHIVVAYVCKNIASCKVFVGFANSIHVVGANRIIWLTFEGLCFGYGERVNREGSKCFWNNQLSQFSKRTGKYAILVLTCVGAVAAAQFRLYASSIDEHRSVSSSRICTIRRDDKPIIAEATQSTLTIPLEVRYTHILAQGGTRRRPYRRSETHFWRET